MSLSDRRWILFYFCCASVLSSFNIAALTAVMPAVARSLNSSPGDVSNIITCYMIPYGLCALLYAPLATRFSVKGIMVITTLLFGLGNFLALWEDSLATIILGRVLTGIAAGAVAPLGLMVLGKIFPREVRGRVIGVFFSSSFVGSMIGLVLSSFAHWHWLFLVPAVAGLFLGFAFCFCPADGLQANTHMRIDYAGVFRLGGARRILLFIFFMSLLFNGVCKWYGVFMDRVYGYPQWLISVLIILSVFACMVGQNIGGWITDRIGRRPSCYVGISILGVSMAALFGHYPIAVLALILSMISIGWTIAHNGISTVLTDFSDQYRSELAALNSAVRFLSGGLGFYLSGNFVQSNFGLTFLIIGLLMLSQLIFVNKVIPQKIGV